MPLDIPMPWLRAPDTLGALSAGGSAGAAAARTALGAEESAARMAAEAIRHNDQVKLEAAQLDQREHIAAMEAATRREIAQQSQLRENQRLAMEQAYHTAQIGLAKGRLEEQKAIADAKGREAALRLQREAEFGNAVAGGMSVMDAYKQFPVPASVMNAFTHAEPKEPKPKKFSIHKVGNDLIAVDPETLEEKTVHKGSSDDANILGAAGAPAPTDERSLVQKAKDYLGIGGGTPKPSSSDRVKVKETKTGKLFTIPRSQLDEALQSGYTKAE